jgi:arylsulfatase A-like enzyme
MPPFDTDKTPLRESLHMTRWIVTIIAAAAAPAIAADPATPRKPNIVLIMADDMGFSDIGCYGGEIQTPNLDGMAKDGLRFTQFYNNAKCTTTRASLLSGMYPRNGGASIPASIPTAGEFMKAAGYRTALVGKWHLGSKSPNRPIDRGFDEFYGLLDGCCNSFDPARRDPPFKGSKLRVFADQDVLVREFPTEFYTTDAFTDRAIASIRRSVKDGVPFFLHLAYTAPHYPLHAPDEDIARYRGKYKAGWDELRKARHARQIQTGLLDPKWKLAPSDPAAYDWSSADHPFEDERMAVYAAMVDRMDRNIGRLLAALKELNAESDTVVLFLSDNGGCAEEPGGRNPKKQKPGTIDSYVAVGPAWGWAQNTPFRRYKSWLHEGGISTPLIIRWPGTVTGGTLTNQVGHVIDIVPTCLELAGTAYPKGLAGKPVNPVEGKSLLPVLLGNTRKPHDNLFWEWAGNAAARTGNLKIVWDSQNKARKWELYDMDADRTELRDLAGEKPNVVREMSAAFRQWATDTGRTIVGK